MIPNVGKKKLGILVGGGPAPGINAVIGAATIEACNQGLEVVGFYDGLKWLSSQRFDVAQHAEALNISRVARIHFEGGSILRISRTNLLDSSKLRGRVEPNPEKIGRVVDRLRTLGIGYLISIGGDDTALSARFILEAADDLRIVHVPKTIDNDLPLPHGSNTFGYATARYVGTHIVKNLMRDSQTTGRWNLITAMGRNAGWLALGIGYSAGATLTLIPEEFEKTSLQRIADVLEGAILKRRLMGRSDGVVVLAEGLTTRLGDHDELKKLLGREIGVDAAGHLHLSDFPIGELLRQEIEARFARRGETLRMVTNMLGYELRSADPTPGDMAYCRSLGHGCIRMLTNSDGTVPRGTMVTLQNGNLEPVPLENMIDESTNRMKTRQVDVSSDMYNTARAYMIRLQPADLMDSAKLLRLADEAGMSPDEFRTRFAPVAGLVLPSNGAARRVSRAKRVKA
jgi:6-phosphofructokinase 1